MGALVDEQLLFFREFLAPILLQVFHDRNDRTRLSSQGKCPYDVDEMPAQQVKDSNLQSGLTSFSLVPQAAAEEGNLLHQICAWGGF